MPRALLEQCYRAALRAADPGAATAAAVSAMELAASPAVFALGKAAVPMARGAVRALGARGLGVAGGLVVSIAPGPAVGPLAVIGGSHPVPDEASFQAADALEEAVRAVHGAGDALVLLSGGTTSLVAAPVRGIGPADLRATFEAMLASGAPINVMNAVRRRLLRWGAGRLALALAPARVHTLVVSDVMGGELAAIGSGPTVPDPWTAAEVRDAVSRAAVRMPAAVDTWLAAAVAGVVPETPKPGDPALPGGETRVILDNAVAVSAARDAAAQAGLTRAEGALPSLSGEAAAVGRAMAGALARISLGGGSPAFVATGGEPTVTLPPGCTGRGGRCQELALACALELERLGLDRVTVLAAGTDGRDGPTDAAGAVVDAATPGRIRASGRDPSRDLAAHDAWTALGAAGALLHTGPTGTNVNDLVLAIAG